MMWDEEVSEGPTWGPQPTRARLGVLARPGGLCPPGAPPLVIFAPEILKYLGKNHIKFSGHSENFYFWVFFYCTGNSENRQNKHFILLN